jgi:hypothetical protein
LLTFFVIATDIGFLDVNKVAERRYIPENDETRSVSDADYSFSRISQKGDSNAYSHPFMHSPFSPFRPRVVPDNSASLIPLKDKVAFSQDPFGTMHNKRPHTMPFPGYQDSYEDTCKIFYLDRLKF